MEVNYTKDRLESEIVKHLGYRSHGYFITLNTQYTTLDADISKMFLERVRDRMVLPFVYANNAYCYGRSFSKRKAHMMRTIAAIEIGRDTQRVHAHLIMLHDSDTSTDRSLDDVQARSHHIWQAIVRKAGRNMVDVRLFDGNRQWLSYITKGFTALKNQYDFPSVGIH